MQPHRAAAAVVVSFALLGCRGADLPENVAEGPSALDVTNGTDLNGTSLNGHSLNGHSLNGHSLNGRTLDGITLGASINGVQLADTWIDGTKLEGRTKKNKQLEPKDFVGAVFTGTLDDDETVSVRVDGVFGAPSPDLEDVRRYAVSFARDGGWSPLCDVDDQGQPVLAIPLAGRWNYDEGVPGGGAHIDDDGSFTFACEEHALAKCVELGYRPWKNAKRCPAKGPCTKVSLADYHQACTRMLRADYCGDGTPHTIDGTLINVYDAVDIQDDTESWAFEAEWTADGARCVSRVRVPALGLPTCWASLSAKNCGNPAHLATVALLISEDAY